MGKKAVVLRVEWRTDQRWRGLQWASAGEPVGSADVGGFGGEGVCSYEVLSGPFCLTKGPGVRKVKKRSGGAGKSL